MTFDPASAEVIFAHRGASAERPEHSRSAYLEAIRQGADGIETDVRATADGALVCWHDSTIERTTGHDGVVAEMSLAELRGAVSGGPDELVTLPELLELVAEAGRPMRLALEIKQPSPGGAALDDAVLAVLDDAGWDPETGGIGDSVRVDIMCFWPQTVERLRGRIGPGLTMLLLDDSETEAELVEWVVAESGGRVDRGGARRELAEAAGLREELLVDPSVGIGPGVDFARCHPETVRDWASSRPVRVWTVNRTEDANFLLGLGVTELTTDTPAALRATLGSPAVE